jgi:hypothetical protein
VQAIGFDFGDSERESRRSECAQRPSAPCSLCTVVQQELGGLCPRSASRRCCDHTSYLPAGTPSPKVFGSFGLRAASLLLYGHVFKGAVGEAFLGLITASQKYQVCGPYCPLRRCLSQDVHIRQQQKQQGQKPGVSLCAAVKCAAGRGPGQ